MIGDLHDVQARAGEGALTGKNRIMIFGPKEDGTYVDEFRAAKGETLAISIASTEAAVIRHFALWAVRAGRGSKVGS
jgi:hypothetical protein